MELTDPVVSVDVSQGPDVLVLSLRGELDITCREHVEPALTAALATAHEVIVDLGNVTFCDSIGLAMFLRAHETADGARKRLLLRNLLPNVWRVFDVTGVHERLNIAREQ
ncbi:MAG TPA: STAS domain-containing protein [Acidimicrobiia bacterium]|nr:STAS domain-containing protein [Acidimicrobiia bacterium]